MAMKELRKQLEKLEGRLISHQEKRMANNFFINAKKNAIFRNAKHIAILFQMMVKSKLSTA